jgi:Ribosomal protein L7/L12 C-terminal domain
MTPAEIFGLVALIGLGLILLFAIRVRLDGLQNRIAAVTRVEAKLDLLLKQANIKFDPFAHVSDGIVKVLRANRKIEAIKLYRQATGVGIKEAKEFIEEVQRRAGMSFRSGCSITCVSEIVGAFLWS